VKSLSMCTLAIALLGAAANPYADARAGIDKGNSMYISAWEHGDPAAMAALYAPDGAEMSGDGSVLQGRDKVEKMWAGSMQRARLVSGTITTLSVELDGPSTAYERGRYSFTFRAGSKPAVTDTGTYFEVWRKQADGSWKIRVDAGFPPEPK